MTWEKLILLLIICSSTCYATITYHLEVIIFKQPTNNSNTYTPQPMLPELSNTSYAYVLSENITSKLAEELISKKYEVIYAQIEPIEIIQNQYNNFVFSNHLELIEDLNNATIDQLKYFSNGYFEDDGPVIKIQLKPINNKSCYLTLSMHYQQLIAANINEKRNITMNEINYFDNANYGVLVILHKNKLDSELSLKSTQISTID